MALPGLRSPRAAPPLALPAPTPRAALRPSRSKSEPVPCTLATPGQARRALYGCVPTAGSRVRSSTPADVGLSDTSATGFAPSSNGASSSSNHSPPSFTIEVPPLLAPPSAAYQKVVTAGTTKGGLSVAKTLVLGILGGAFIGIGCFLMIAVGAACPGIMADNPGLASFLKGAIGIPLGLILVLVCGAELFTGNTALVLAAAYEGKVTPGQLVKNWTVSYIGNLLGSLLMVSLVAATGLLSSSSAAIGMAVAKTSIPFTAAVARGVLANLLVCCAVWQATAASTLPGKAIAVFFPISAFVALGLEHSVANMFIIPMGMALGAPVSAAAFAVNNLVPVTLGNIAGGALGMATTYSYIFGKLGAPK